MRHRVLIVLAVLTVALGAIVLAGCGDSDDDASATETETETEMTMETDSVIEDSGAEDAEVQTQIAAVLLDVSTGMDEFLTGISECTDFDCLSRSAQDLRELADDGIDDLDAIDVSERGNECQADVVSELERGLRGMTATASAIEEGDTDALDEFASSSRDAVLGASGSLEDCL